MKIDRYWLSPNGMIKLAKEYYDVPEAKVYEWVKYDDIKHLLEKYEKIKKLVDGQKDIDPGKAKIINDNFWDLI
jgi:hypothetical protein